jgi:dihydrofolate reductase
MRKVIYLMMVSLDGFVAGPHGEIDWPIIDEELHTFVNEQQRREIDMYLYGRRIYRLMARDWPPVETDPSMPGYMLEFARIWKAMPKVVFSKTLDRVEWNSRLDRGDNIAQEVARLKAQPGKAMSVSGANLASTFIRLGLVDEYRLFVHPVVLGGGTPYFPPLDDKLTLRLVETRTLGSGVVYLRYERQR